VSVPSAILTDRGGEFMGEVVEALYQRLGMAHLKTSAYRPQMDATCEQVHFSVHNLITKLVGDKHERWPDLLGTTALAYNATVHTSNCFTHLHRLVRWMHWSARRCQSQRTVHYRLCRGYRKPPNSSAVIQENRCSE